MTNVEKIKIIFLSVSLLISFALSGQVELNGLITDEDNFPLPGATVLEKGTGNGTVTDFDGNFKLTVSADTSVLLFSYLGYWSSEEIVGVKRTFNIVLSENTQQLEDVVVIGYQTIKKSDITGSVSKIETENLSEIPANSIEQLLVGRVAGLTIGAPSDDPGAGVNVRIRGASSFTATTPLIVVDGFPLGNAGNLKQINPADIISVEVLKDASAASIYGSRGANGVILITTRRGEEGNTQLRFSAITTISDFASKFNTIRNPLDLAVITDESRANANLTPIYVGDKDVNGTFFPSIDQIREGYPTTDYIDYVFDTPINTNYNLGLSGGNAKSKFNFGLNYNTQNGIVRNNDLSKITASFGVDQVLHEKVSFSINNILSRGVRNDNGGLSFERNMFFPLRDENDDYFKANDNDFGNPAALSDLRQNETTTVDLISSSILSWQITEVLQFKTQFNYSLGKSDNSQFFPTRFTQLGNEGNNVAFINNFQNQRVVADAYFTYDKLVSADHKLTLLAGFSSEYFEVRTSQLRSQDFVNGSLGAGNLSLGNEQRVANNFETSALQSVISRANYAFKDKLLFTFTGRMDGSSKFGVNNRYAFFPSGAVSWKMHREAFVQKALPFINELKPRVSWGITGNQAIQNFETLNRLGQGQYFNNGQFVTTVGPGVISNNGIFIEARGLGNPDLKWENTQVLNIGLDVLAFDTKLEMTLDLYNKTTNDLLVDNTLPPTSGFDFVRINAGKIENKGIELSLNYAFARKKDWRISAGLILNKNINKVLDLGPPVSTSVVSDEFGNQYRFTGTNFRDQFRSRINTFAIGQPVNVFYGAIFKGIIQDEDQGLINGLTGNLAQPGEFLYEDINGDGIIDPFGADRTIIGDPNPAISTGLTFNIAYKNWDFTSLLNASIGVDVVNLNKFQTGAGGGQASSLLQRWTLDNQSNDFPALRQNRNVAFSDWWIEDASFVRIQNLRLGYNFNKVKFFNGARLYFNIDNLYVFTKYKGVDPEVGLEGIDQNRIPRLRRFSLGLELAL